MSFFHRSAPLTLEAIATLVGSPVPEGVNASRLFSGVAPLDLATENDVSFFESPKYRAVAETTKAGLVLVAARFAAYLPKQTVGLVVRDAHRAFAAVTAAFFPSSLRPGSFFGGKGISPGAYVHPDARLEPDVTVDPGAVIGPGAQIGSGTFIGPGAVIGPNVCVGRECSIGPQVTVQHALIGNRVILHPGVQIGQDGFGYLMSARGHTKSPQVGRVIVQDDVEIGANSTIDRGANRDTTIGEGTKIDNLVQIGHNVRIGRHCILVGQVGIAGSSVLEDFVVVAGAGGVAGHVIVGRGAQIAGASHAKDDVPAGARYIGTPAKPVREWTAERLAIKTLAARTRSDKGQGIDE